MIHERLADLERKGTPITIGIIGAGTFGTQIIAQTCRIKGMRVAAIADLNIERGMRALKLGGISEDNIQVTTSAKQIHESIDKNISAVTSQAEELFESNLDIIVEATGIPEVGAVNAYQAIQNKKNLVMVTVEADVLVGYLLKNMADKAGVLYSMAYGDEPALACELCDWARTLGFQLISSGKGTRFNLEFRKANPDDVPKMYGFTGKDYNASMFCSFLDGTKHSIEMAALSNATGLIPDVRGMHFPTADLRTIPDIVCHKDRGGILSSTGVVEAVSSIFPNGQSVERNLRGGLYAVVEGQTDFTYESMSSYGDITGMIIGKKSRHAMIYRPQNFIGHEVAIGIARMMIYKEPVATVIGRISEVVTAAKKLLTPGTKLDGEGGYATYGMVEKADVAREERLVPIGLTHGAEVIREIPEDGMITYDNVHLVESKLLDLRKAQDNLD